MSFVSAICLHMNRKARMALISTVFSVRVRQRCIIYRHICSTLLAHDTSYDKRSVKELTYRPAGVDISGERVHKQSATRWSR